MSRPNLFHYATSELSQDAFFCWLAKCADPKVEDLELREVGQKFLELLLSTVDGILPVEIEKVEIRRQWNHIDILVEVNDKYAILIEDKAGTADHSGQLDRYRAIAEEHLPNRRIVPVYIQTYIQPGYHGVRKAKFGVVERKQLLEILPEVAADSVLAQFREHLLNLDSDFEAYRILRQGETWSARAWQGYFNELSTRIEGCGWNYVSNPSGGFFAAHWAWTALEWGEVYLQLSEQKLSVRILVTNPQPTFCSIELFQKALGSDAWTLADQRKPRRGRTQNLVTLDSDHRRFDHAGSFDLDSTVVELSRHTESLARFIKSLSAEASSIN
ncbi:MAG TPA: PD-(D/E)XK nuclease family protein [Fimbriimonas sp.]|nr:PD-(D/E)XK nuclease family protein [Fimbriimonas sp.]